MTPDAYLAAARVPTSIPSGLYGWWSIGRQYFDDAHPHRARVGFPSLTYLRRLTLATLHKDGDVVMEDSREELAKHLPIMVAGRGRVLVSGLGLGCAVRGLLANPAVTHVDVVELDREIIRLVAPSFDRDPRLTIRHGDALKIKWPRGARWDFAWHDIWTEEGNGLPLHCLHLKLFARFQRRVGRQGAWALPREVKRFIPRILG